jgi:hypothetical protein
MSLQLEVGKSYRTRNGREIVTIKSVLNIKYYNYPYIGDNGSSYMSDGRLAKFDEYHDNDLVEEVITMQMFSSTWAFPNFKQVETSEETKMQDQIITINCTLVVRDIEGTLTLQVHPKDESWRADMSTTVLDSNFELVLPKAKVQELYLAALNFNLDKAEAAYNDTLEARDNGAAFIRSL